MDGTLLEKKYDLVARIEALEESQGEEVVYLPGDGISIQEVEEGEREVSVLHDSTLILDADNKLSVDFSRFKPLLYSSSNSTQIGVAVISGYEYSVYRKYFHEVQLANNTDVTLETGFLTGKIILGFGGCARHSNQNLVFPMFGRQYDNALAQPYIVNGDLKMQISGDWSNYKANIYVDFCIIAEQESKKKD